MYDDTRLSNPLVEITIMLYQARETLFKAINTELEDTGLNYIQAFVLAALRMSNRPITISEIAPFLFREAHTTSELVTRMEKRGYLKKDTSPDDKRCVRIQLTPKGIERLDEVARRIFGLCERLYSSFSREQLEQFNTFLREVRNQAIQEIGMETVDLPPHISMDRLNEYIALIQDEPK